MISSSTNRVPYAGAGSTGPFAFPFKIQDAEDLRVIRVSSAGLETVLTLTTDYTVAGVLESSGTVTLTAALAVGESLIIRRDPELLQETSIRNGGPYFASNVEDALDLLVMQMQALNDEVSRSVKLKESLTGAGSLVELEPTAGKVVTGTGTGFTMSTLDSSAVALPGGGRTVSTLSAYLANNIVFNVKDYGALGNGVTNDSAAIAAAESAAYAAGGLLYFPPGSLAYITGATTTTIRCHTEATGAKITYSGTGVAILAGQASGATFNQSSVLPEVTQGLKTVPGWAQAGGADVGVRYLNQNSGFFWAPHIKNFAVGVDVRGEGTGCVYNHFWPGYLENNKVNWQSSADATGWSNENSVHGGRFFHNSAEGAAVAGTRHVLLTSSTQAPNNWRFLHCSLEGDVAEFHTECFGSWNLWDHCRWEVTGGARVKFNGASAFKNLVRYGYQSDSINFTESGGAVRNNLMSPSKNAFYGSVGGSSSLFGFASSSSSGDLLLAMYPAGTSPLTAAIGTRTIGISANDIHAKATGDAGYRVQITSTLGRVGFCGDGSLTVPTEYFVGVNADGIKHVGTKFGFFNQAPVARAAALTQTYATANRTLAAYVSNAQAGAYVGAADGEAKLVDLNALRVAYETLRASHDSLIQFVNALVDDLQAYGLEQ